METTLDLDIHGPVFCRQCGMHMADHDLHPDPTKRWLRCLMCGYSELCNPKRHEHIKNQTKESPQSSDQGPLSPFRIKSFI